MVWLLEDLRAALETFGNVAATDPISALLLLAAALVFAVIVGVGGVLGFGALSNTLFGWP